MGQRSEERASGLRRGCGSEERASLGLKEAAVWAVHQGTRASTGEHLWEGALSLSEFPPQMQEQICEASLGQI